MHAECMQLNACHCFRHILPLFSNIVQHRSEVHAMHAAAKRASTSGIGTDVCMRTGQRRPSVHVQGEMAPNCACAGAMAPNCACAGGMATKCACPVERN